MVDPVSLVVGLVSGYAVNLTTPTLQDALRKVFAKRPDLEQKLASQSSATQGALQELAGELQALAGSGSISVDGSIITALRSARFDHQSGRITMGNSSVSAPVLETGGTGNGQTHISGNTVLRSQGTAIHVGHGAGIVITGNAGIKQT